MQLDDPAAQRLLAFCSRLPSLAGDKREVEANARHTLACFDQRQREVQAEISQGGSPGSDLASLRCESDALVAARSVVLQLWQRRFDEALPGA
jgi:hypothetical protein